MPVSKHSLTHGFTDLGKVACSHCTSWPNLAASNCSPTISDAGYPAELRGPDIRYMSQCSMSEHSVESCPSDMLQARPLGNLDPCASGGWCLIYHADFVLCRSPSPAAMQSPSKHAFSCCSMCCGPTRSCPHGTRSSRWRTTSYLWTGEKRQNEESLECTLRTCPRFAPPC
jgi:hypothetical protein